MSASFMGRLAFASVTPLFPKVVPCQPCRASPNGLRAAQSHSRAAQSHSTVVGPFCPLLTYNVLRRHVEVLSTRRKATSPRFTNVVDTLEIAKKQIKERQRGRAEWTYAELVINLLAGSPKDCHLLADALFALALVAQKRDVALARYAFQLAVQAARDDTRPDTKQRVGKYLVSWGLFESKQPGKTHIARKLIQRAVQIDPSKAPVLKWKCVFGS